MTYPTRVYGPHIGRRRINGDCPPDKATRYSARLAGTGGKPAHYSRPEGEPSLLAGVALLVFIALVAVFAVAAIGV